jgi:chromate transport protein ChrA
VNRILGWLGKFWAKYTAVSLTQFIIRCIIIIIIIIITTFVYNFRDSFLKEFYFSIDILFLYVTYTMEFLLSDPDSRVIQTTLPPYSPDDQGSTLLNCTREIF